MTLSLWGFAAYVLLYLAVVTGTAMSSPWLRRHLPMAVRSSGTHTILSLAGSVACAVHTLKGVVAPQGSQFEVLLFLTPNGTVGLGLGLGLAALYGLAAATAVVYLRHALAGPLWRGIHAFTYPAFAAAAWHGLTLGANAWLPVVQQMYAVTAASATGLGLVRLAELLVTAEGGRGAAARGR